METRLANGRCVRRSTQFIKYDEIRYSHSGTAEGASWERARLGGLTWACDQWAGASV